MEKKRRARIRELEAQEQGEEKKPNILDFHRIFYIQKHFRKTIETSQQQQQKRYENSKVMTWLHLNYEYFIT